MMIVVSVLKSKCCVCPVTGVLGRCSDWIVHVRWISESFLELLAPLELIFLLCSVLFCEKTHSLKEREHLVPNHSKRKFAIFCADGLPLAHLLSSRFAALTNLRCIWALSAWSSGCSILLEYLGIGQV